jgi:hypothetical protein
VERQVEWVNQKLKLKAAAGAGGLLPVVECCTLEPNKTCTGKKMHKFATFTNLNSYAVFYVGIILKELIYDQTHLLQ